MKNKFISFCIISSFFVQVMLPTKVYADSKHLEHIFYYLPSTQSYQSLTENYEQIDIFAPQLYTLDYTFKLLKPNDKNTQSLAFAREKKMKVMPLVHNQDFSKQLMTDFLKDHRAQKNFINQLIREARKQKFIGWQFDFENINHHDREAYARFVEQASQEFKKKKLIFSVAVIPRTRDYDQYAATQDWSSGYNIKEIAKYADFISVMSYDDPLSRTTVASMPYVEAALNHTLKYAPASKISLGIPFYCWQWDVRQNKKIANIPYSLADSTKETYKNNSYQRTYSTTLQAENIQFTKDNGEQHSIWCDNYQSIAAKISYAEKMNFRGTSAWALGLEDSRVWNEYK